MTKESENWVKCPHPVEGDTIRWKEPIWAAPSKPRGKPAKMGDQQITAEVTHAGEFFELLVLNVAKIAGGGTIKVKAGDEIRRKSSTIAIGDCYKRS
ncbi:MAG: hypothetical protein JNL76_02560 [Alphaproteobacteria bacterium]|jgi:hypothetical protein|nr:hypothetical protein [Alphaproteobacteria bacterium]